jgi:hypothetical protein
VRGRSFAGQGAPTFAEIAKELGVCEQRAYALYRSALYKITHHNTKRDLERWAALVIILREVKEGRVNF